MLPERGTPVFVAGSLDASDRPLGIAYHSSYYPKQPIHPDAEGVVRGIEGKTIVHDCIGYFSQHDMFGQPIRWELAYSEITGTGLSDSSPGYFRQAVHASRKLLAVTPVTIYSYRGFGLYQMDQKRDVGDTMHIPNHPTLPKISWLTNDPRARENMNKLLAFDVHREYELVGRMRPVILATLDFVLSHPHEEVPAATIGEYLWGRVDSNLLGKQTIGVRLNEVTSVLNTKLKTYKTGLRLKYTKRTCSYRMGYNWRDL